MNNRFLIMLITALVLAGGAAWMAKNWVDNISGQKAEENVVPIVAAAIDISYGAKIDAAQLKMLKWPKDNIPKGAFTDKKFVIGKIAQRAFVTDEALLEPQIKEKAVGSILSALISEGMRAVSVRVDDVSGVAGFVSPKSEVDIFVSYDKPKESCLLLSKVKVLAGDQNTSIEQDKAVIVRTLTLEMKAEDVMRLENGRRYGGQLQFALRNPLDKEILPTDSACIKRAQKEFSQSTDTSQEKAQQPLATQSPVKPRVTIIDWPSARQRAEREEAKQ